jgi:cytoskeletal protein RodZ
METLCYTKKTQSHRKEGWKTMKMKRLFFVLLTTLLFMIGACSNQGGEDTAADSTQNPEENSEASSGTSEKAGEAENEDDSAETSQQSDDQEASSSPDEIGVSGESETANEHNSEDKDFDIESYLDKNYAIDNTHYKADIWKNEETGKSEYTIKIIPDNKEFSEEINKKFQNAGTETYEETELLFNKAEQIINDVPKINDQFHVDSVNWVSYDGTSNVMLIQDFRN